MKNQPLAHLNKSYKNMSVGTVPTHKPQCKRLQWQIKHVSHVSNIDIYVCTQVGD